MKLLRNDKITQKIIIILIVILISNFTFSNYSNASASEVLISPIQTFILWVGDGVLGLLQQMLMGSEAIIEGYDEFVERDAEDFLDDATDSVNILDWLVAGGYYWYSRTAVGRFFLRNFSDAGYTGPVVLVKYSIPAIVSNKVPAFDINYFSPIKTQADQPESTAKILRDVIQKWYAVLRTIALVALLSVLVYIGIKIIISSSLEEKAKYKTKIVNWVVALVILFTLQYIMAGTLYVVDVITNAISKGITYSQSDDDKSANGVNLTYSGDGYDAYISAIRTSAEMSDTAQEQLGYTIMYMALIIIILMFTFIYFKRTVYIAFLTMAAPLIAVTYPIDKENDGKAQAFSFWLKEYIFNVMMQIIHLLLYFIFVGSAIELAEKNVIYGLISMGMIIPAEKIVRKMFNIEKAGNESALSAGGFFEGALAASALSNLSKLGKGSGGKASEVRSSDDSKDDNTNIRTADPFEFDDDKDENNSLKSADDYVNSGLELGASSVNDYDELDDQGQAMLDWMQNQDSMWNELDDGKVSFDFGDNNININQENNANSKTNEKLDIGEIDEPQNGQTPKFESKKPIKGYRKVARGLGAVAKQNYKAVGRGALKLASIGMGAVGGSLGVAATIATGNINNLGKYTAAGVAAGAGSVHLAANGVGALGNTIKNAKAGAVDIADTYRIGANNMTEKEYQDQVLIPRMKKQNSKNADVIDSYKKEFGDTKLMSSSTRDEMYKAGIVDEKLIIKALKEKQKNSNLSDTELTRDAILSSKVKNYKDLESIEKKLLKQLEQKGVFDKVVEKMEKDGKFDKIDKKLEKKYLKVDNDDSLSDKEKVEQKQKLRTNEVQKEVEKEKTKMVQSEVKRIEKLSGI